MEKWILENFSSDLAFLLVLLLWGMFWLTLKSIQWGLIKSYRSINLDPIIFELTTEKKIIEGMELKLDEPQLDKELIEQFLSLTRSEDEKRKVLTFLQNKYGKDEDFFGTSAAGQLASHIKSEAQRNGDSTSIQFIKLFAILVGLLAAILTAFVCVINIGIWAGWWPSVLEN
jgi:hypothetical protein